MGEAISPKTKEGVGDGARSSIGLAACCCWFCLFLPARVPLKVPPRPPRPPLQPPRCHDFRRFPTFLCLSPKRPHSFTQPMTCFPFPFPHDPYLIFYPTFYLIFLFGHFGYQGQVRSIRFTRRLVSLGLPKEFYLLGSHRPFKPHCVHVGNRPLDLLRRGHLWGIQDPSQG